MEYTRAINHLTILSPIQTAKGKKYGGVSRFVYEAGIEVTEVLYADEFIITNNNSKAHYGEAKYV